MMNAFRRKKIFVERGMQLRFARFMIVYNVVCCLTIAAIVFYTTSAYLGEKIADIYPQSRLPEIFNRAYLTLAFALLASIPILFYGALLFSHRIAGPLPKIYRALDDIGKGNFNSILTLRKNDELRDLADHINQMTAALKAKYGSSSPPQ